MGLRSEFVSLVCRLAVIIACGYDAYAVPAQANGSSSAETVTFHGDVLPILRKRCVSCHTPAGTGPFSLGAYSEAKLRATAIAESVKSRRMPPWSADPGYGVFANDPRLNDEEIRVFEMWATAGAPAGKSTKQRSPTALADSEKFSADLMMTAPRPIPIPANQAHYQYLVIPLSFTRDRWIQAAEIRPSDPSVIDHAVLYVRDAGSEWLRNVAPGVPYAPSDPAALTQAISFSADILAIYAPGLPAMVCPDGMAKKVPAGGDLVLQVHYKRTETAAFDQPQIGLAFATEPPKKRVLTLQMRRSDLRIVPGEVKYNRSVAHTLQADAVLLSMFPYIHRRGVEFDFEITEPNGRVETILKVKPSRFAWQLIYVLNAPQMLPGGTELRWTGYFDTAASSSYIRDVDADAGRGEQPGEETMLGYVDVAVETRVHHQIFLKR